jgi:hypothetical protein
MMGFIIEPNVLGFVFSVIAVVLLIGVAEGFAGRASRQNSLPSGSPSSIQLASGGWPTSLHPAPRARRRESSSDVDVPSARRSKWSLFLPALPSGTGTTSIAEHHS